MSEPYPYPLPRWLHRREGTLFAATPEACDAALANGWVIDPNSLTAATPVPEPSAPPVKKGKKR